MANRIFKNSLIDTAPPLSIDEAFSMNSVASLLFSGFGDDSGFPKISSNVKNIRFTTPAPDVLNIKSKVKDMCYNCNGSLLFIATRDTIFLFNVSLLQIDHSLLLKSTRVLCHPRNPDIFLVLLQNDAESGPKPLVHVYKLEGRNPRNKGRVKLTASVPSEYTDPWYSGCFSVDGKKVALLDRSDKLQFLNFDTLTLETRHLGLDSECFGLVYTKEFLVVQKVEGNLDLVPLDGSKIIKTCAHSHIVTAAAYSLNGNLFATGGSDHSVHIFDATNFVCTGTFPRLAGQISSISFSNDGQLLAWGTKDNGPNPLDDFDKTTDSGGGIKSEFGLTIAATDPCEILYYHPTPSPVTHVTFSPTQQTIAYACDYDTFSKSNAFNHSNYVGILRL